MIIFTPLENIPEEYLIYKGIKQVYKFNLSSYYNAQNLQCLVPNPEYIREDVLLGDATDPVFDIEYHNYILNNNEAFCQFMSIIIPVYTNPDCLVHIMIKQSNYRDVITESLCKFIQQRYGYNPCIVNSLDDFVYATESDFSIPGLFIIDGDIAKWHSIVGVNEYEE